MPNLTLINLTPPNLPSGYCPANYQQLANDIVSGTQATFNSTVGNSFFNFGPTTPALNNQIFPWLDDNGEWWIFNGGYWSRKNPVPAGGLERRIFVGTTTDLQTYDGGNTNSPSNWSGPMWEVDTAFEAKFPVGVGTFAASGVVNVTGSSTSTSVSGEDKHKLIISETPFNEHTHGVAQRILPNNDDYYMVAKNWSNVGSYSSLTIQGAAGTGGGGAGPTISNGELSTTNAEKSGNDSSSTLSHNNLPPFYGVYFIKRTARIYYTK